MKKLALAGATLAVLAMSAPAMAADLSAAPVYKAPIAEPVYDWTGFYVGLNGGYSWGRSSTDFAGSLGAFPVGILAIPPFSISQNMNGGFWGGQVGYNARINHNWLLGFEADLQATGQKGATAFPGLTIGPFCQASGAVCETNTLAGAFEQKLLWFGTARARFGFLPSDRWMLYATGGLALGRVGREAAIADTTVFSFLGGFSTTPVTATTAVNVNATRVGWTVGAGSEWVIAGPWSAKFEYLYVDLGRFDQPFGLNDVPLFVTANSHVTDSIVRVGINYRFGGNAVAGFGGPGVAAESPAPVYKAPAMPPTPIYGWTGFYAGVNGGFSWGHSATDFTLSPFVPFSASQNLNGWVGGAQAGYNWQLNRNWVFGVEADLQATRQHGSIDPMAVKCLVGGGGVCINANTVFEQDLHWFGTGRLRLGFLPTDHWLLYATGGVAFGEVQTTATFTEMNVGSTGAVSFTQTAAGGSNLNRVGWTAGAGTEWAFSGPWSAKFEYLYVDLGTIGSGFVLGNTFLTNASRVTDSIVRVGLNYRFGSPVVAKY